ncbi:MAG: hypothetical protein C0445_05975 [Polaromonas sp.]|nr:hypothetical protein [Polaromonas sp.]
MQRTPPPAGDDPLPTQWRTSRALQACLDAAMAEAPGLVMRWAAGLAEVLRQQEAWTISPREKADLSTALKELSRHRQAFETRWVANWRSAIGESLAGHSDAGPVRRTLSNISFDDLELMDELQVQATVQVARLEQVVESAAGDALSELTALLSSAQGHVSVRMEHNPLRPDVAIAALRRTMEGITRDKSVRTLWLQHGTQALGEELQLLYRHLIRILSDHGVQRADYHVLQAPSPAVTRSPGARNRPPGVGDQHDDLTMHHGGSQNDGAPVSAPAGVHDKATAAGTDLLTLDGLHHLLVGDHGHPHDPLPFHLNGAPLLPTQAPVAGQAPLAVGQPAPDLVSAGTYRGPDRRAHRDTAVGGSQADSLAHLQALAQGVVQLLLEGMTRDERLLAPVRQILGRLQPALLRIARDDPRFIADKLNPARRLLEEITQRSLAFDSAQAPGFGPFLATLEDVVQLFSRSDTRVSALFETALEVLQPQAHAQHSHETQGRAVASLVKAEQRHLLAEKLARELATRLDFSKADPVVQQFIVGPWAQVIAQAKMGGAQAPDTQPTRMPADLRYQAMLTDLIWSSRVEVASRNRGRLSRLIPGLLRTLREGLQSIDYDPVASRQFFSFLMSRHEAGLKGEGDKSAVAWPPELILPPAAHETSGVVPQPGLDGTGPSPAGGEPWLNRSESADTGFIVEPFPTLHTQDFADTEPMGRPWDGVSSEAAALAPASEGESLELAQGAWVELQQEGGQWVRLQLSWASPHGTMYLFTGQGGSTTSMTRRSFDSLCAQHRVRVVAAHSLVDDALGSVLDTAVLNSARAPLFPAAGPKGAADTHYPDLLPPLS